MSRIRRIGVLGVTCAALIVSMVIGTTAASARPRAEVLLSGLSSPKALTIGTDGNPIVGQGAFGPPGPILEYVLRGPNRGTTIEFFGATNVVDIAVASDNSAWAIGGDLILYRVDMDGNVDAVLDIPAYQETDPDPVDQGGDAAESNPYGLTVLPDGDALVTDAQNNDLLRVTPGGDATTVARFDLEAIGPDDLTAEAVPTTVTVGPDGMAYVGELKGYPFTPETSHVWRIDPDADGAFCSVDTSDPDCSVYADGFTAIQDIAFNQRNGRLYVLELAAEGVPAFEEGFGTGDFPPAVLLKVKKHERVELAAGRLSEPGGIAVAHDGTVFVTDGMFSDGRLLRIRG
jgi:hypothetical protein